MAKEFRFPDVGEGITEGEIVRWLVKEGDEVQADQTLAEIETDKAIVEMPSPYAGTVLKLHFK
ncbi:MAG TPA: biotin/lipoyl-containing protein, partial [Holophaga sp.]|nr:biotin/lipoyl-containing protein [Holophaga sp.]